MKAMVWTEYGPPEVLQLKEVETPTPKDKEVLIRIYATTVTAGESRVRSFTVPLSYWLLARLMIGLRKPKKAIPGMTVAGENEGQSLPRSMGVPRARARQPESLSEAILEPPLVFRHNRVEAEKHRTELTGL